MDLAARPLDWDLLPDVPAPAVPAPRVVERAEPVALAAVVVLEPWAERMLTVFWWFFALAGVILMPWSDRPAGIAQLPGALQLLVSPLAPLAAWYALHAARRPLRRAVAALTVARGARVALVGAACGLVLALKTAAHGELVGTIPLAHGGGMEQTFLVYACMLASWLVMRSRWALNYHHVFWFGGLAFALIEEKFVVARTVLAGDTLGGALLLGYLLATFGLPFAAVFLLAAEDLPASVRRPHWLVAMACALVPVALYKWSGAAWHCMLGSLCL